MFASTAQMTSLVAEGMGLAIGATFSVTVSPLIYLTLQTKIMENFSTEWFSYGSHDNCTFLGFGLLWF